jgi:hypothetical protein
MNGHVVPPSVHFVSLEWMLVVSIGRFQPATLSRFEAATATGSADGLFAARRSWE